MSNRTLLMDVSTSDGKWRVTQNNKGVTALYRHGEATNFNVDNPLFEFAQEVESLREQLAGKEPPKTNRQEETTTLVFGRGELLQCNASGTEVSLAWLDEYLKLPEELKYKGPGSIPPHWWCLHKGVQTKVYRSYADYCSD